MTETIGFIGVGEMAEQMVIGLMRAPAPPPVVLSPRNRDRAGRLAERHPDAVTIAQDNAAVVAASDLVVLATAPRDIVAVAAGLPWRAGQTALSVAAAIPLDAVAPVMAPAEACRCMPVTAVARGESETALTPDLAPARALLARLGSVHPVPDDAVFEPVSMMGAHYGWLFRLVQETVDWLAAQGLDEAEATALTAGMMRAAAGTMAAAGETPAAALARFANPGGITVAGIDSLADADAFRPWAEALDAALVHTATMRGD